MGEQKKQYKCRCTKRTKRWIACEGNTSEKAAMDYAKYVRLIWPEVVTVRGHGRYKIYTEVIYHAQKI